MNKYVSLFFSLFPTDIPLWVLVGALVTAVVASVAVAYLCKDGRRGKILMVWIASCVFLMLYVTVLGREQRAESVVRLMPLWSVQSIRDGYVETAYEKIYNVLFFMPLGALLALYSPKRPLRLAIIAGLVVSVSIELLQYITRTGTCETDDVICNTLGCVMGALIFATVLGFKVKFAGEKI